MSANFYNTTWSDNFPIDYDVAHSIALDATILFGVLWSILPICFALSGSLVVHSSSYAIVLWMSCWLSLLVVFVGCMVFTKYAADAGVARQHDYLGPMRVKGTRIYTRQVVLGCNTGEPCVEGGLDHCCFHHQYAVQVELEWGYDWACPDYGKQCISHDTYEPCTHTACKSPWPKTVCDAQQSQQAEQDTRDCAEMLYRTDLTYPDDYNPRDPPGQDWPTWLAFGDCSTCTSRFIIPSDRKIRHLKVTGCIFLFTGISIWIVLLIRWIWRQCQPSSERDCTDNESAMLQSNRATYYGSNGRNGYETSYQGAIYSPDFDY